MIANLKFDISSGNETNVSLFKPILGTESHQTSADNLSIWRGIVARDVSSGDAVVAIAAIKGVRGVWNMHVQRNARCVIPSTWRELGYVWVSPKWRGKGLSKELIKRLLEGYTNSLYAVCCNPQIEKVLSGFGFQHYGVRWNGKLNANLSLYVKDAKENDY